MQSIVQHSPNLQFSTMGCFKGQALCCTTVLISIVDDAVAENILLKRWRHRVFNNMNCSCRNATLVCIAHFLSV